MQELRDRYKLELLKQFSKEQNIDVSHIDERALEALSLFEHWLLQKLTEAYDDHIFEYYWYEEREQQIQQYKFRENASTSGDQPF